MEKFWKLRKFSGSNAAHREIMKISEQNGNSCLANLFMMVNLEKENRKLFFHAGLTCKLFKLSPLRRWGWGGGGRVPIRSLLFLAPLVLLVPTVDTEAQAYLLKDAEPRCEPRTAVPDSL